MSTPTYNEGQEINFGIDGGTFTEAGFLHGATVRVVEARYGKLEIPVQYQDPKNPIPPKIAAKFTFSIKKQDGTEKVIKAQEYSTGIQWDGDDSTATVSPDGKKLVAKKGFKGFSKQTDFYHLLETAVNAGFPQDNFKGDLSVFDNLTFQMVSEPNPRAGKNRTTGEGPKGKPFFGLLIGSTGNPTAPGSVAVAQPATPAPAAPAIDPSVISAGIVALSTLIAESSNQSIARRDIAAKVPPIADKNGWDLTTRKEVMQALFDLPRLQTIASAAGLKLTGETVSV